MDLLIKDFFKLPHHEIILDLKIKMKIRRLKSKLN